MTLAGQQQIELDTVDEQRSEIARGGGESPVSHGVRR